MNNTTDKITASLMKNQRHILLSSREAAEFLGIKNPTIASWRFKRLNLPYLRIGGKCMYKKSDLLAFLEKNTILPDN